MFGVNFGKKESRQKREFTADKELEEILRQKEGLAKIQTAIIKEIRKNPDVKQEEISRVVEPFLGEYKISETDKRRTEQIIFEYLRRHDAVKATREKYQNDKDLYQFMFGKYPEGEIEVVTLPITFYFKCKNPRDYAFIYSGAFFYERELSETDLKQPMSQAVSTGASLHDDLVGAISAEDSSLIMEKSTSQELMEHEEQHSIKILFAEEHKSSNFNGKEEITDPEIARKMVENYLKVIRKNILEDQAKNEILAYMKTGVSARKTYEILTAPSEVGAPYEYLNDVIVSILYSAMNWKLIFQDVITPETIRKIFEDEYWKIVANGCKAFEKLQTTLGYTRQDAVNLLTLEPLKKWKKLVERLEKK